jgi:phosphatidylserine synthase
MIKQFLKISFYSFVTFCVFNFSLLILLILFQSKIKETPEVFIGFPINFYKLFPNESMNYTTRLDWTNFFNNFLIFWILIFLYFIFKNFKQKNNQNPTHP